MYAYDLIPEGYDINLCGAPRQPGVYMIVSQTMDKPDAEIVYVGSSKNMQTRVYSPNHLYSKLYREMTDKLVAIAYKITEEYRSEEIEMIRKFRPIHNKIHNNGRVD